MINRSIIEFFIKYMEEIAEWDSLPWYLYCVKVLSDVVVELLPVVAGVALQVLQWCSWNTLASGYMG